MLKRLFNLFTENPLPPPAAPYSVPAQRPSPQPFPYPANGTCFQLSGVDFISLPDSIFCRGFALACQPATNGQIRCYQDAMTERTHAILAAGENGEVRLLERGSHKELTRRLGNQTTLTIGGQIYTSRIARVVPTESRLRGLSVHEFINRNMPAQKITWLQAFAYGEWLKETTGYDFRLPTEKEWEGALRLRLPTLEKMNGAICHWTADPYDRRDPSLNTYRALRGYAKTSDPKARQPSFRDLGSDNREYEDVGFRLALTTSNANGTGTRQKIPGS